METHALEPDDVDAVHDLWVRGFGPGSADGRREGTLRAIRDGRLIGVYDSGRLVGSGLIHAFEQWWHGRAVPMGGVAAVCVAPEERGRGVGRLLATALLDHMADRPLSVLFPATAPVYRSVGYEHAGGRYWLRLRPEQLRTLASGPVAVRRAVLDDAAHITALIRRLHAEAGHDGPIDRGESFVRDLLSDESVYCYLADDGFLAYSWRDGAERLTVHRCLAGSAETARALWAVVGSGSSIAEEVVATVAPADPLLWLLRDRSEDTIRLLPWMLRVLDAPAAIAARGFPPGVTADVPLLIEDEQRPANSGGWRLTVGDGRGRLERAGETRAATRLPARALAALYAGVPLATLRGAGIVTGPATADPVLDVAFAATAFMLDGF